MIAEENWKGVLMHHCQFWEQETTEGLIILPNLCTKGMHGSGDYSTF